MSTQQHKPCTVFTRGLVHFILAIKCDCLEINVILRAQGLVHFILPIKCERLEVNVVLSGQSSVHLILAIKCCGCLEINVFLTAQGLVHLILAIKCEHLEVNVVLSAQSLVHFMLPIKSCERLEINAVLTAHLILPMKCYDCFEIRVRISLPVKQYVLNSVGILQGFLGFFRFPISCNKHLHVPNPHSLTCYIFR